jgi:type IV secretion system protein VirB9
MKAAVASCLMLVLATAPALAQVQPQPAGGDPHLQVIDYDAGQIVLLRGAPGYQMMIELSPDEQVQSVAVGDSSAWEVSVNKEGDRLFLKPAQPNISTNMTVVTSVRIYNFDLSSLADVTTDMPYSVHFRYPATKPHVDDGQYVDVAAATKRISRYKVAGNRELWPAAVTNDGQHTFISWPRNAPIPAVYALDRDGHEALVNGMMGTDDIYEVDGVPDRLMFRIDNTVAYAVRLTWKKH